MMLGEMERRTENHLDRPSDGGQQCKVWVEARNEQTCLQGSMLGLLSLEKQQLGGFHQCPQMLPGGHRGWRRLCSALLSTRTRGNLTSCGMRCSSAHQEAFCCAGG